MARLDLSRGSAVDAHDVVAKRTREDRAKLARRKCPHPLVEFQHEVATPMPTQVAANLLGRRIHRFAFSKQCEVAATLDLGEDGLGFHSRDLLRRWCRQRRAASVERLLHFVLGHVRRNELAVFAQLLHGALDRLVAAHLIDEHAPILFGRS